MSGCVTGVVSLVPVSICYGVTCRVRVISSVTIIRLVIETNVSVRHGILSVDVVRRVCSYGCSRLLSIVAYVSLSESRVIMD